MKTKTFLLIGIVLFIAMISCNKQDTEINKKTVQLAQQLIDLDLTETEIDSMMESLRYAREDYKNLRTIEIENAIVPRLFFDPRPKTLPPIRNRI